MVKFIYLNIYKFYLYRLSLNLVSTRAHFMTLTMVYVAQNILAQCCGTFRLVHTVSCFVVLINICCTGNAAKCARTANWEQAICHLKCCAMYHATLGNCATTLCASHGLWTKGFKSTHYNIYIIYIT